MAMGTMASILLYTKVSDTSLGSLAVNLHTIGYIIHDFPAL